MVGAGLSKQRRVTWRAADLSWLEQVQASAVGESGAAHLYVFYVSWRLWEAHLYVFYVSWRLWEGHLYVFYASRRFQDGPASNEVKRPGGSLS